MYTFQTIHPVNQQMIQEYIYTSEKDLEKKLKLSEQAYSIWKEIDLADRIKCVRTLENLIIDNEEKLAKHITLEMGKPIKQSLAEIKKCLILVDYYCSIAEETLTPKVINADMKESYVRYETTGAIFGIMPWNFPFWQVFRYAIPNLIAGNVVLLKHALNTTGCGVRIQKLMDIAKFPKGCFQTLIIDIPLVENVISSKIVSGVSLTGSMKAGASVASLAGKYIKKSVLELGGNDAFIVCKDADLDRSAKTAVFSRMINTGQTCISAKRFIVSSQICDEFVEKVIFYLNEQISGDIFHTKTQVGVLARKDLADKLQEQLKLAVAYGAKILHGGQRKENYFQPTLIQANQDNIIVQEEEFFGPIAILIKAESEEKMLEIANSTPYGLGASIWTKDINKAKRIASKLEVGCVAINDFVKSDPRLPFGGTKKSGYGRELSPESLITFTNEKVVYRN